MKPDGVFQSSCNSTHILTSAATAVKRRRARHLCSSSSWIGWAYCLSRPAAPFIDDWVEQLNWLDGLWLIHRPEPVIGSAKEGRVWASSAGSPSPATPSSRPHSSPPSASTYITGEQKKQSLNLPFLNLPFSHQNSIFCSCPSSDLHCMCWNYSNLLSIRDNFWKLYKLLKTFVFVHRFEREDEFCS